MVKSFAVHFVKVFNFRCLTVFQTANIGLSGCCSLPCSVSFTWILLSSIPFDCDWSVLCSILCSESFFVLSVMRLLPFDWSPIYCPYFRFNSACLASMLKTYFSSQFSSGLAPSTGFLLRYSVRYTGYIPGIFQIATGYILY